MKSDNQKEIEKIKEDIKRLTELLKDKDCDFTTQTWIELITPEFWTGLLLGAFLTNIMYLIISTL